MEAYAFEVLKKKPEDADQYFFEFLQYVLEIKQNTSYRTGFKIWKHSLTWKDKNSFRLGYIFFGNPNERSTTVPIQQFYIYYCPIFAGIERNDEPDEVYFDFSALSEEFKSTILRYGAASAKEVSASTDQKKLYRNQIEEQLKLALSLFEREFVEKTVVIHTKETRPLKSWSLKGEGSTKQIIFSDVTSRILDDYFNDKYPDYPAFKDLRNPLTETNFDDTIKNALKKIVEPERPNRDGEAILAGLGLWSGQSILVDNSRYANRILQRIKDASGGTVINKSEIIYAHHEDQKLYYSVDYNLDHQLQFVVLVALVFKGDIEIIWSQAKSLTAGNMDIVLSMPTDDYFTFSYIKRPQGIPYSALKSLFSVLGLPDFSNQLDNHETIQKILTAVTTKTGKVTETLSRIRDGVKCRNIDLLPPEELKSVKAGLEKLTKTLDGISAYNTSGKLKLFKLTGEELKADFQAFEFCNIIESLKKRADEFEKLAGYLAHAVSYLPDDIPLRTRINGALSRLGEVIIKDNKTELKQYETLLKSLKDEYIKYYLESYLKYRLSASDYLVRETLLSGKEKLLCDQLKDVVLTDKSEYQKLIDELSQLKEADHSLSKDRLETVPYDGFNPRDYHSKPKPDILSLKQQLEYILESWKNLVVSTLKDPGLSGNLDYLPSGRQNLIKDILNSETEITLDNAGELRAAITGLMQGIDKVEISQDEITKLFNRPLSPSEAIDNFTSFIEELSKGKERVKVRIILKNATTH